MKQTLRFITGALLLGSLIVTACKHDPLITGNPPGQTPVSGGDQPCSPDTVYFQNKVLPLLISNCAKSGCHDAASHQEDVVLNNYTNIMNTGEVRPGNPGDSKIYKMITETDPNKRMPRLPNPELTPEQKQIIYTWILQGAKNNACQDCDSSGLIRYSLHIAPLLQTNCTGCHSGGTPAAGLDLTVYNNVKTVALNGKLKGVTHWLPGYPQMPRNAGKLSACRLAQIEKWISAGATNN